MTLALPRIALFRKALLQTTQQWLGALALVTLGMGSAVAADTLTTFTVQAGVTGVNQGTFVIGQSTS